MSAFQVLETFYRDFLAVYPPQGEDVLQHLPSDAWRSVSFRYIFSVEAMTKVSRIIEDAAAQSRRTADLHVSFQFLSRFLPQQERYRALSEGIARGWIYAAPDIPDPWALVRQLRMQWINVEGTPLVRYWFVIAYGPGLSMSLLALEVPSLNRSGRYYEGFYTFEPDIAYQLTMILHLLFPNEVPLPRRPEALRW